MDWLFALGEAILTVIIGVTVYALGEVAVKFYIEPVNKLSDVIGEVLDSLVFYSNIYTNSARAPISEEENKFRLEAQNTLRQKATLLSSRESRISLYSVASFFRAVPKKESMQDVYSGLIFLSNSCFQCNPIGTSLLSERIIKLLTSREIPPKVPPESLVIPTPSPFR
ncbi:MAG: hypothetical protein ABSB71_01840 [Candidatus Bathyarchaeia archaeon]|jgi:hypothetical protein